ncbi:MAG: hypothetical protein AB7N76_21810 [Planctomycetota bacterium]
MTRCPYCHDTFDDYGRVCAVCLARHHDDCWSEAGRCASCAGELPLGIPRDDAATRRVWRWICLLASVPTGAFGVLVGWLYSATLAGCLARGLPIDYLLGLTWTFPPAAAAVALPLLLLWAGLRGPFAAPRAARPAGRVDRAPRLRMQRLHGALERVRADRPPPPSAKRDPLRA